MNNRKTKERKQKKIKEKKGRKKENNKNSLAKPPPINPHNNPITRRKSIPLFKFAHIFESTSDGSLVPFFLCF
jgi:hypothetical protein